MKNDRYKFRSEMMDKMVDDRERLIYRYRFCKVCKDVS